MTSLEIFIKKIWEEKLKLVMSTLTGGVLIFALSFTLKDIYSSSMLLKPSDFGKSSFEDGLSLNIPFGGSAMNNTETEFAVAILTSKDFFASLLNDDEIDVKSGIIEMNRLDKEVAFDELFNIFHKKNLDIIRGNSNNFVRVTINTTNPNQAYSWASAIVEKLNLFTRQKQIDLSKKSIKYLEEQLKEQENIVVIDTISNLLEKEFNQLMLAEVNEDFEFTIIDSPRIASKKSKPIRSLYASLGAFFGFFAGLLLIFFREKV